MHSLTLTSIFPCKVILEDKGSVVIKFGTWLILHQKYSESMVGPQKLCKVLEQGLVRFV
jgi:hypothetical protein